jgi:UDP-N-acetylmuramoyl-L-alanyl-D-glutamate--2,6-diaminopimelate ligase
MEQKNGSITFCWRYFTNLSHDHLDYHPTFAEYRDVKNRFSILPKTALHYPILTIKQVMLQNTVLTYALKSYADYKAQILKINCQVL